MTWNELYQLGEASRKAAAPQVPVFKGKVRKRPTAATAGISNNVAQEFKKSFSEQAMEDYAQQSRGVAYCLRLMNQTRYGKEE